MVIIEEEEDDDNHLHQQKLQPSSPQSQPASNRKHHRTMTLPTEIFFESLLNLPVESLYICKLVSKSWHSLISEPHFVKSHLHRTRLIFSLGSNILKTCCVDDVMMSAGNIINNNGLDVIDYPLKSDSRYVRVIGSCNGLLCLYIRPASDIECEYPAILFIWNPSTRNYHKLPSDGRNRSDGYQIGFGYDDTDDYKVVQVFPETVKMYSLRSGGWKDIGAFPIRYGFGWTVGKFLNGAIHWCVSNRLAIVIVSLDLATETYGEVVQPVYDEGQKEVTLGTLGKWLCVLCDYYEGRVDLWVMKAYGVKESWTKLMSVPYTPDPDIFDRYLTPLCISSDGKILFIFGTKLTIYDYNSSSFSDVQNFDEYIEAYTFYESLVSPLPPAADLEHRVEGFNG